LSSICLFHLMLNHILHFVFIQQPVYRVIETLQLSTLAIRLVNKSTELFKCRLKQVVERLQLYKLSPYHYEQQKLLDRSLQLLTHAQELLARSLHLLNQSSGLLNQSLRQFNQLPNIFNRLINLCQQQKGQLIQLLCSLGQPFRQLSNSLQVIMQLPEQSQ